MPDNSDDSKGLAGPYVKTTKYGPSSLLLRSEFSAGRFVWHSPLLPLKYKSQSDWLKYL